MKVRELIEKLRELDPEREIFIQDKDDVWTLRAIESVGCLPSENGSTPCLNPYYFEEE